MGEELGCYSIALGIRFGGAPTSEIRIVVVDDSDDESPWSYNIIGRDILSGFRIAVLHEVPALYAAPPGPITLS